MNKADNLLSYTANNDPKMKTNNLENSIEDRGVTFKTKFNRSFIRK